MTPAPDSPRLRDIGEEALVARLLALLPPGGEDLLVGPGDDCAVVRGGGGGHLLLKTDCIVEGVHFPPGTDPALVGRKALNRALSDIAAMGGRPRHALVTVVCDEDRPVAEVEGWYRGLAAAAQEAGCTVAGGETARLASAGAVISVALSGTVAPEACRLRSGASAGDLLLVTGRLGGSLESGRHLRFRPRLEEGRWLAARPEVTAMMDLSDGLGSDLPRLARSSRLGFRVDPGALPLHPGVSPEQGAGDGEDYELLLSASPGGAEALLGDWAEAFPGTPLTVIGALAEPEAGSGGAEPSLPRGWEHYRQPRRPGP